MPIGLMLFWLVIVLLVLIGWWKVFEKAGQPGWAAIIPIYNLIVLIQIARKPIWWIILFIIPIVNIYAIIVVYHRLAKSFGKDVGFTIGLIFLNAIFMCILGFGDAQYTPLEADEGL